MTEEEFNEKGKKADPDKDFGLPKVEIKPIQQAEEGSPQEAAPQVPPTVPQEKAVVPIQPTSSVAKEPSTGPKSEKKGNNYTWIILVVVLVAFGLGAWFFYNSMKEPVAVNDPETEAETEPAPVAVPVPEPKVEVPVESKESFSLSEIRSRADLPRYFVVVGSFIDEDMAKDFSEKLHQKDMNTFLIYPYGEIAFFRLAIGQFESFELAVKEINRVKDGFNENLWVLKY